MSKSLFRFNIHINNGEKKSIIEIAEYVWNFLSRVKLIDEDENTFCFLEKGDKHSSLFISEKPKQQEIELIANKILSYHEKDILKNDRVRNPTIEFARDWGFSFLITWHKSGKEILCFSIGMGRASNANYIGTMSFSKDYERDFEWYYKTLKHFVKITNPLTAAVSFAVNFLGTQLPYVIVYPGWISYISNNVGFDLPATLVNAEVEDWNNGKFIIVTREEITQNKEYYDMIKQRVVQLFEELKNIPGYIVKQYE